MSMLKKHVFGSLNLNNSKIFRLSFEDIFLGTLDTYTKIMNKPSTVLRGGGGGVHGKVCWLIAYYAHEFGEHIIKLHNQTISMKTYELILLHKDNSTHYRHFLNIFRYLNTYILLHILLYLKLYELTHVF